MQELNAIEIDEVSGGFVAALAVLAFVWYNQDTISSICQGFAEEYAKH